MIILAIIAIVVVAVFTGPLAGGFASMMNGGSFATGFAAGFGGTAATGAAAGASAGAVATGHFTATGLVAVAPGTITAGAIGGGVAAGAAGSIVSQAVGMASGIQDKFSWNAVALAAVGGGVGAGVGQVAQGTGWAAGTLQNSFVHGAVSSAITQGIGKAIGAQDKFSWAGVAGAGVGAYVAQQIGGDGFGAKLARNGASAIANAATRSLMNGGDFGDNLMAALPDVIAQTVGEAIAGRITTEVEEARARRAEQEEMARSSQTVDRFIEDMEALHGGEWLSGDAPSDAYLMDARNLQAERQAAAEAARRRALARAVAVGARGGAVAVVLWPYDLGGGEHDILTFSDDESFRLTKHRHDYMWDAEVWIGGRSDEELMGRGRWVDTGADYYAHEDGDLRLNETTVPEWFAEQLPNTVMLDAPDGPGRVRRGFAVSVQNDDERQILRDGIGQGWDSDRINRELDAYRSSFGTATSLSGGRSVWDLGWALRGETIETGILGPRGPNTRRTPPGYRIVDNFDRGVAISVKSINLNAPSYHNIARLDRLLTGYVDRLAAFDGGTYGPNYDIPPGRTTSRELIIAIPNEGTRDQQRTIERAMRYGARQSNPVVVRPVVYNERIRQ